MELDDSSQAENRLEGARSRPHRPERPILCHPSNRGDVRADALGSVLQVHVGRFWGPVKWDTFLVSDFKWETGFGLLSPS